MRRSSGVTVANWCPCSASSSFSTTAAWLTTFGSYIDSTVRPDLAFLEPVENIGGGNRLRAFIFDVADHGPLGHDERDDDAAAVALFGFEPDVVEAVGVPQRHEIAAQRVFVIDVADFAEDHRPQAYPAERGARRETRCLRRCSNPAAALLFSLGGFRRFELRLRGRLLRSGGRAGAACGTVSNGLFAACGCGAAGCCWTCWRQRRRILRSRGHYGQQTVEANERTVQAHRPE